LDVRDTYSYFDETVVEEVSDRSVWSNASLKRMVKPILSYVGGEAEPVTWFYVGARHDHIIIPRIYCSCKDYLINVMSRKRRRVCRHLVIQYIAEKNGLYRVVSINDPDTYMSIVNEIIDIGVSLTLRKLLHGK